MDRFRVSFLVLSFLIFSTVFVCGQENASQAAGGSAVPASDSQAQPNRNPIPPNSPRMTKQTRFEIIRDFETQMVYTRTAFPMGTKGLRLKDGVVTPNGEELRQALALWGPAVRVGDPAHISYVQIKDDHIHFEINGGPVRRRKWYQHIEVAGSNGGGITPGGQPAAGKSTRDVSGCVFR